MKRTDDQLATSSNDSPINTLLTTKLHIPQVAGDLVHRPHLIDRLNRGVERKLTLISAPAGYGKTSLAAAWLQTHSRKVAWLSLDEEDSDLNVFLGYLVAAIRTVFPDACPQTEVLFNTSQMPSLDYIATTFLNEITSLADSFILVLDDFQTIRNDLIHELITKLIHHLPSNMHLVVCSRTDPHIHIAQLRVYRQMTEIRISELCFNREDINYYLEQVLGEKQSIETVTLLEEKTEGWIAGIRLAAISMRESEDMAAFVKAFKGVHYNVMDFLVDEVLASQPQAVNDFLLQTSLLKRFCVPLCEAVTDFNFDESQKRLVEIEQQNLFLVPLDYERNWYRYHNLFQDLLRRRLHNRLSREEVAKLHGKASAWLAQNGYIGEALRHTLAAGAVTEAARLVEQNRHDALNREEWATLERWLELLPEETIQGNPALLLAEAWILDIRGQLGGIPHLLQEAEALLSTDDAAYAESELQGLRGEIDALWCIVLQWSDKCQQALEHGLRAVDNIPNAFSFARSMAVTFLALAYQSTGQAKTALALLGKHLASANGQHVTLIARMLYGQTYVHLLEGNLNQAAQTIDQVQHMLRTAVLPIVDVVVHWLSGRIKYEWNDLDAAREHLNSVFDLRYGGAYIMAHDSMLTLALTYHSIGKKEKADETMDALRGFAQESGNLGRLHEIDSFEARLSILRGNVQPAAHWAETVHLDKPKTTFFFLEFPWATKARVLIAQGTEASLREATRSLEELLVYAESLNITYRQIELLAHLALAYQAQGQTDDALQTLERSVNLAKPGGFIRTFVDLGRPIDELLKQLEQRGVAPDYINRILDAFLQIPEISKTVQKTSSITHVELVETLTERELEVLQLLGERQTDKEIAQTLSISVLTAKTHARNIYQKLDVKGRKQAVTQAKILGILPPD